MTTPLHGRARSWLINGALLAGSLVLALLLAELVLRVVGFSAPVLWTYDDITGSKLFAGAEGWQRTEGEAYIKVSRDGLRDREHSKAKPPNTLRIAVLGDSMTEALQVDLQNTFWSVLERELRKCKAVAGRGIEVINFGVSGYGTAQELLAFRHRAAAYSPDVTVLAFYPGNDVQNNSRELESSRLRPFFSVQDGKLVPDNGFLTDREYLSLKSNFDRRRMLFNLRTFQLIRKVRSVVGQWEGGEAGSAPNANIEPGLADRVFLAPQTKAWSDAWEITERLILALRDEVVAAGGGRFVVFTIPIGIQVYPKREVREQFMRSLNVGDLWYPEARIRDLAKRNNLDAMTLGRSLQSYAEENQVYLHGFSNVRLGTGHLNETGHKLVGESLARHLCR